MNLYALALLASAATAAEWGNPYGDRHSSFKSYGYQATPSLPRLSGPTGPRHGPTKPSSRFGKSKSAYPRRSGPRHGYFGSSGRSNAKSVIGDGYGDGYGHGRGFANDDQANLEVDIDDKDIEFDIERDMDDQDIENDLEIELADIDHEKELEDHNDTHVVQDGQLYGDRRHGYGGYGRGGRPSVSQIGLASLSAGRAQKTRDQSYTLNGGYGGADYNDAGSLNRGRYGFGGRGFGGRGSGYGGYNAEKSYDNIKSNIGESNDNKGDDDRFNSGSLSVATYGAGKSNFGNRGGYGKAQGPTRGGIVSGRTVARAGRGYGSGYGGYGNTGYGSGNTGYGNVGYGGARSGYAGRGYGATKNQW